MRVDHGVRSNARVSGLLWTKTKVATGNSEVREDEHVVGGGRSEVGGGHARDPGISSWCSVTTTTWMAAHEAVERCEGGRPQERTRSRAGTGVDVGERSRGGVHGG